MSKGIKLFIGLLTLVPLVYIVFFFMNFMNFPNELVDFDVLFKLHLGAMLLIVALLIFYIANIFKNDRVHQDQKALWAIILFCGGTIAMPIYWYLYIWKEDKSMDISNDNLH